jgi:hypothetical protein
MKQKLNMQLSNRRNLLERGAQNKLDKQKKLFTNKKNMITLKKSQDLKHTTYKRKFIWPHTTLR